MVKEIGVPANSGEGQITKLNNSSKKKLFSAGILNFGFIGVDSYMRMKEGESAPVAVGKAVLTNAALELIPGGIPVALGLAAVASAPEIMNSMEGARGALNSKKQAFNNTFQHTESQVTMMQTGLGNMQSARTHATRAMANHARGAQRVY